VGLRLDGTEVRTGQEAIIFVHSARTLGRRTRYLLVVARMSRWFSRLPLERDFSTKNSSLDGNVEEPVARSLLWISREHGEVTKLPDLY